MESKKDDVMMQGVLQSLGISFKDMVMLFFGALATALAPFLISANGEYSHFVLVGCCFFFYSLVQGVAAARKEAATMKACSSTDKLSATVSDPEAKAADGGSTDEQTKHARGKMRDTSDILSNDALASDVAEHASEAEDVLTELRGAPPVGISSSRINDSSFVIVPGSWAAESDDMEEPRRTPEPIMGTSLEIPESCPPSHSGTVSPPRQNSHAPRRGPPSRAPSDAGSTRRRRSPGAMSTASTSRKSTKPVDKTDYRKDSVLPVTAPVFEALGWNAQVDELCKRQSISRAGLEAVQQIAQAVQRVVMPMMRDGDVDGYVNGSIARGLAFNVAVPEIDIVLSAEPEALLDLLPSRPMVNAARRNPRLLQKTAIRACTDTLIAKGGFTFRRSSFRTEDPKVTLHAPPSVCGVAEGVAFNFSINNAMPLHDAALITECEHLDPRAKALILFVRRWAKDRGIAHVSKGHLPPYAWSLLCVYYLQVCPSPILPPMCGFPQCSKLAGLDYESKASSEIGKSDVSVADLFKGFVAFFADQIKWADEAVSVRAGRRAPPSIRTPLNIFEDDDNTKLVAPVVVDPFTANNNLGEAMTRFSVLRLRKELVRANWYCRHHASLTQLLEPWSPPEQDEDDDSSGKQPQEEPDDRSNAMESRMGEHAHAEERSSAGASWAEHSWMDPQSQRYPMYDHAQYNEQPWGGLNTQYDPTWLQQAPSYESQSSSPSFDAYQTKAVQHTPWAQSTAPLQKTQVFQ